MTTKTIRARALSTRHELVRGGDGKPRTTDKLCEIARTPSSVMLVVADTWERITLAPADKVRVRS